jgi:hypothetical protein
MKSMLYVMSPSYSGSTLLTFLLANHPAIATVGELKASALGDVNEYVCSCGQKLVECDFWAEISSQMVERGYAFGLDRFRTHFRSDSYPIDRILRATVHNNFFEIIRNLLINAVPGCRKERDEILAQNREMVDLVLKKQGAECFLDGSKDPNRLKYFFESELWDLRVIFLVRDGRGVANSYMNHVGVDMVVAATEWRNKCEEMFRLLEIIPRDRVLRVRYEDLCRATDETLKRVITFTGFNPDDFQTEFTGSKQHILGNAMRLRSSGEVKLDEKWKRMLTEKDLSLFAEIGGNMNQRLGYE